MPKMRLNRAPFGHTPSLPEFFGRYTPVQKTIFHCILLLTQQNSSESFKSFLSLFEFDKVFFRQTDSPADYISRLIFQTVEKGHLAFLYCSPPKKSTILQVYLSQFPIVFGIETVMSENCKIKWSNCAYLP